MDKNDFFWAEGLGGFAAPGHTQKITPHARVHKMPKLEPCEIDGRGGYWKATHGNGLVQVVWGTKAGAMAKVREQVGRLNDFERWARAPYRNGPSMRYF